MTAPGATMRGVVLTGHGGLDRLEWREGLPRPVPGPGEVLIRVRAAAVNNTDINTRQAWYSKGESDAADATWTGRPLVFPHVQGIDACGEVVGLGPGADPGLLGRRVLVEPCLTEAGGETRSPPWFLGSECQGSFAEYLAVAARHAHPVTSDLSDVELATFPCSYSTALNLVTRAGAAAGQRALVTGGSGGVGSAAVQILRDMGLEVVAVTAPSKAPGLRALGAADTIDRDTDPVSRFGADAFDLVIDLVGGPAMPRLLDALRPRGHYAVSGAVAGAEAAIDLRTLYLKDLTLHGCTVLDPGVFAALVRRIETGRIRPLLAATYDLKDIRAAQTAFLARTHIGKIGLRHPADT